MNLKEMIGCAIRPEKERRIVTVLVLTYCRNLELFYGTELIFKTLRVGFPNAEIVVVDNASLAEARDEIRSLAEANDCVFQQIPDQSIQHNEFIRNAIFAAGEEPSFAGPLIFVDPDICFWESCEDFDFDGLIAGRLVAGFNDTVTQTYTMPRLHTAFLWIPDARKLRDAIWRAKVRHFDFEPFTPYSCVMNGKWYRYDTGASLYAALPNRISKFSVHHLNCYDHIYCGSHIDWLNSRFDPRVRAFTEKVHKDAKEGNLEALKGIWEQQDKVWLESMALFGG